jgi:DNA polymerase-3 subunit epsilon
VTATDESAGVLFRRADEWHVGPLLAFDLETTGVDIETDRIVTAALARVEPGRPVHRLHMMADPGIEIPEGASKIHGITTAVAKQMGKDPKVVINSLLNRFAVERKASTPLVGMNLSYDLSLLDREMRRHGFGPLQIQVPVIDVAILDKQFGRRRKGSRRLDALCEFYDVKLEGAHDAMHDAIAAARVAWRMRWLADRPQIRKYGDFTPIARMRPDELHDAQVGWRKEQCDSLRAYFDKIGKEHDGVNGEWPIRSAPEIVDCDACPPDCSECTRDRTCCECYTHQPDE